MTAPDLQEHLLSLGPNVDTDEQREAFRITDDDLAGWALRKLSADRAEVARIEATAQVEIDRIQAWALDAAETVKARSRFLEGRLGDYFRQLAHDNPKLSTHKLPQGSIGRRKNPDRLTVNDEVAFIAWAEAELPRAIKRTPLVSAFKGDDEFLSVLTEGETLGMVVDRSSGQPVPGVVVVRGEERIDVKPAADLEGPF